MTNILWLFPNLVTALCFLGSIFNKNATVLQEKANLAIPVATLSPPEGKTTFVSGSTWYCVARTGASPVDMQIALDWACGVGGADCDAIQYGGPCFEPNTLHSHASYAFNSYYQRNVNSYGACDFRGTATITTNNPSYGNCTFPSSGLTHLHQQHLRLNIGRNIFGGRLKYRLSYFFISSTKITSRFAATLSDQHS